MLDKIENGIKKTTVALKRIDHILSYVVVAAWLAVGIAALVKLVMR